MNLDNQNIYKESFQSMPLGLFILDKDYQIIAWNDWLSTNTDISAETAIGKEFTTLFEDVNYQRFTWAVEQTINYGSPQFLSQILNRYLIPIKINNEAYENIEFMQQDIEILPLKTESENYALIIVKDVTGEVHQKNVLMEMGYKLEEESLRDSLTGAYNRRYLWEFLEQQIAQAKRDSIPLCCIMLDLDHFKNINDTYGHVIGDNILIEFSKVVLEVIRSSDVLVRYGGEEFLVILPHSDMEAAFTMAERIRISLQKVSNKIVDGLEITCSAGVSLWEPTNPDVSPKDLVNQADSLLYKAKSQGRNQTVSG